MGNAKTRRLERWTVVLVVGFAAVSVLTLWAVFLTASLGTLGDAKARQTDRLQRDSRVLAVGLGHLFGESRLGLELVVHGASAHPGRNLLTDPEFLGSVQTLRSHDAGGIDLQAVTGTGALVSFGPPPAVTERSVEDRDFFRRQRPYPGAGLLVDGPVRGLDSGGWALALSLAVPPNTSDLAVLFVALRFSQLDRLVGSLSNNPGQTVSLYLSDGTFLYANPLPRPFPAPPEASPMEAILATGQETGMLSGTMLQAFQKVEELPVWVVVSRPEASMSRYWEMGFYPQLFWAAVLTLALGLSALGLVSLLSRLRTIRMAQEALARVDPLTGLLNRRAFLERCELEQKRMVRHPAPLGLVLLDLDHFKEVNDRFGHQAGDQALRDFAQALVRAVRGTDALARLGGEEFAILLPGTGLAQAAETAERVRAEAGTIPLPEGFLTTSAGVALGAPGEPFEDWYRRADQALYRAKRLGRNRVETDPQ